METMQYIGLDVHKKTFSYCIKSYQGQALERGTMYATRPALKKWLTARKTPWIGAMEATMFTGWVFDFLNPHVYDLKVDHPEILKAITAAKKKNDRTDAEKLADLLRVNLLPECTMMPAEIRELRRILRYRNMIVRTATTMKNEIAGLLMETGVPYNKHRLYGKRYFNSMLQQRLDDVPESAIELLQLSRSNLKLFNAIQKKLINTLRHHETIRQRVENLMSIPGVGEILALTWVVEMGDIGRFNSSRQVVNYCGLCSAQRESAGKELRGPLSKKTKQISTD
jgi:transposase